jgi:hypothetical protein
MILSYQRIQQRIHTKSASAMLGVESGGDGDLSVDGSEDESGEEEEEGGEVGEISLRNDEEVAGIALLAAY